MLQVSIKMKKVKAPAARTFQGLIQPAVWLELQPAESDVENTGAKEPEI